MRDKIFVGILLLIALFPWEIWAVKNVPYVEIGIINQLQKNPRNFLIIIWFFIHGWYLLVKAHFVRRYMPLWLITTCVIVNAHEINDILRYIVWLSFALSGPIVIRNLVVLARYLRIHYFLSLLSLSSLSFPFSGYNENPNRYARDHVYDYKYGRLSILLVLPMVIFSGSRGALLFFGAYILTQYISRRGILLTIMVFSMLIPLIFFEDSVISSGRNFAWVVGISGFLSSPFFGNGWIDVLDYLWTAGVSSTNFHNIWIEVLFRFGMLGLIGMLWLIKRSRLIWLFPFLILGNVESFLFGYSMDSLLFWGFLFHEKSTIH